MARAAAEKNHGGAPSPGGQDQAALLETRRLPVPTATAAMGA